MLKRFSVTPESVKSTLPEMLAFIRESLERFRLNLKEANRAQLMAEEALVRLVERGDFEGGGAIQVNARRFLGSVTVDLSVPGHEFDFSKDLELGVPLDESEMSSEAAEAIQNILLRSFEDRLRYRHKRGVNRIRVTAVQSRYANLYLTLGALVLALATGLLLKGFASAAFCAALNETLLLPIRTVFMNGLKMCAAPVAFLSVATCFSQYGDLSEVRRLGSRLMLCFLLTQIIAVGVGLGMSWLFNPGGGLSLAPSSPTTSNAAASASISIRDTLVNLMPSNLIRPFLEGNMLQLIILAVFMGTSVAATGANTVRAFLQESNDVFMRITAILMRFIPLVVFCSITSMCLTTGGAALLSIIGIFATVLGGLLAMAAVYWLMTAFVGRLNPARLFSKALPMMATAFSTSSSNAAIPDNMRAARNMGISPKVYSLSIPLGTAINKNGTCVHLVIVVLALARIYGVHVSPADLLSLGVSVVTLAMAMPGLGGVGIIEVSLLLSNLSAPVEAVGLIMGVDPMIDMCRTVFNCLGTLTSTLTVAAREGLLDREAYNKE